jgi:hypothetical protein
MTRSDLVELAAEVIALCTLSFFLYSLWVALP